MSLFIDKKKILIELLIVSLYNKILSFNITDVFLENRIFIFIFILRISQLILFLISVYFKIFIYILEWSSSIEEGKKIAKCSSYPPQIGSIT